MMIYLDEVDNPVDWETLKKRESYLWKGFTLQTTCMFHDSMFTYSIPKRKPGQLIKLLQINGGLM